jgi:hypothetical protein
MKKQNAARESWGELKRKRKDGDIYYTDKTATTLSLSLGFGSGKGEVNGVLARLHLLGILFKCAGCGFVAYGQCKTAN